MRIKYWSYALQLGFYTYTVHNCRNIAKIFYVIMAPLTR